MSQRLVKIFEREFWEEQSRTFCFKPSKKHSKVIGIIASEDVSVSLSLDNGTSPKLASFKFFSKPDLFSEPPNQRLLEINEELCGCVITGVITNNKQVHIPAGDRTIKLFLLIEENEN